MINSYYPGLFCSLCEHFSELRKNLPVRDRSDFDAAPTSEELEAQFARRAIEMISRDGMGNLLNGPDVMSKLLSYAEKRSPKDGCYPAVGVFFAPLDGELASTSITFDQLSQYEASNTLYQDAIGIWHLPTYRVSLYRAGGNMSPSKYMQSEAHYSELYKFAHELEREFSGRNAKAVDVKTFAALEQENEERLAVKIISKSPVQKLKIHRSYTTAAVKNLPSRPISCKFGARSYLVEPRDDGGAKITRTS